MRTNFLLVISTHANTMTRQANRQQCIAHAAAYLKRIASAAVFALRGCTRGAPIASAMRSESVWSTAANTETAEVWYKPMSKLPGDTTKASGTYAAWL